MSRILILGGAGFIGSHLTEHLSRSHEVEILVVDSMIMGNNIPKAVMESKRLSLAEMDIVDTSNFRAAIECFRPEIVWHLAANSDIQRSAEDGNVDLRNTFGTTSALILSLAESKIQPNQIIFSSTSAVYGNSRSKIREDSQKKPDSAYGWMKLASEFALKQFVSSLESTKLIIARFPNVTGSRQTHGVVKDLVQKYFDSRKPWEILGNGYQTKPYIHVSDLVRNLVLLATNSKIPKEFEINISPDDTISVREIVEIIEQKGQLNRTPHFGTTDSGWPGDVPNYMYNIRLFESLGLSCNSSRSAIERSILEESAKYKHE